MDSTSRKKKRSATAGTVKSFAKMAQQNMFIVIRVGLSHHHGAAERKVRADLLTREGTLYIRAECEFTDTADKLPSICTKGPYCATEGMASSFFQDWLGDDTAEILEQRFDLGDLTSAVRVAVADDVGTALQSLRVEDAGYRAFSDLDVFYGALAICTTRSRFLSENETAAFFRRLNGLRTCFRKKMERLQEAAKVLRT